MLEVERDKAVQRKNSGMMDTKTSSLLPLGFAS
jgi:hypothetical protein